MAANNRPVLNDMLGILRTCALWRDLPGRSSSRQTLASRSRRRSPADNDTSASMLWSSWTSRGTGGGPLQWPVTGTYSTAAIRNGFTRYVFEGGA